jgi:hypothetical protein
LAFRSASRAARASRLDPAGGAAMLLGICAPELAGHTFAIDERDVDAMAYGRVSLLVTFVDPVAYEPERLASIRADATQFTRESSVLERAVERARTIGPVIPAKPLTVYAPGTLELAAREHVTRWSRALSRLGAKRECVVHVYSGPHVAPADDGFVARITGRASRSGRAPALRGDERVVAHASSLFRACSAAAISTRRVASSPLRGALWTASFLLAETDVEAFELLVERSTERGSALGVSAHFEGPRLPYSFV